MSDSRAIAPTEDPVCGMTVDVDQARRAGLTIEHEGREYAFCGKGCVLDFRDNPGEYLKPDYQPTM